MTKYVVGAHLFLGMCVPSGVRAVILGVIEGNLTPKTRFWNNLLLKITSKHQIFTDLKLYTERKHVCWLMSQIY